MSLNTILYSVGIDASLGYSGRGTPLASSRPKIFIQFRVVRLNRCRTKSLPPDMISSDPVKASRIARETPPLKEQCPEQVHLPWRSNGG